MNNNNFASALNSSSKRSGANKKGPSNFAEALRSKSVVTGKDNNSQLAEMLANPSANTNLANPDQEKIQKEQLEQAEYEKQRLELHKKINPVDQRDVFNAQEEATKKKIDTIKSQLRKLAREVKKLHKTVDITLMGESKPGLEGVGEENFLKKLETIIKELIKRVRSARQSLAWQNTAKAKQKKKVRRGKGLGKEMMSSKGHEQRQAIELFFNSERGDNMGE